MQRLVLLIGMLALLACGVEPTRQPIRLGLLVWPPYELFFLAQKQGYYDCRQVELVEYSSNADVVNAFRTGALDAVAITGDHFLDSLGASADFVIILVVNISHGGDALVARPEIESLENLQGARVGLTHSSLGVYMVSRALDHAGLDFEEIVPVYLDEPEQEAAYENGAVDAVAVFEPVRSRLVDKGAVVLFDSSRMPGEIVDVLVVRRTLVESHADELQHIIDGFFRARGDLLSNPRPSAQLIAGREGLTPEQFLEALQGVNLPGVEENLQWLGGPDRQLLRSLETIGATLERIGATPGTPDLTRAVDDRFVREAVP
jgi:NitT/TauT family transport system substrate-binding protein